MKIYISGPITGLKNKNKESFDHMAQKIADAGHEPVNPFDVCAHLPETASWADYMREDIKALMGCKAIVMLDGWVESKGAKIEWMLADWLGIRIMYQLEFE